MTAELLAPMYKIEAPCESFISRIFFNSRQTSACTLILFYTQSIINDKRFHKQQCHVLYNQTAMI